MTTITVNSRGTLTLPMTLRKKYGLTHGGSVIAEETSQGIMIKPSVTYPIELYTDSRVREFDETDAALDSFLKSKAKKQ